MRTEVIDSVIADLKSAFIDVTLHAQTAFKLASYIEELESVWNDPAKLHVALLSHGYDRMNALHLAGATDYDAIKAENAELRAQLSAQVKETADSLHDDAVKLKEAAAQPVAHQFYEDGKWHNFQNDDHYRNTVAAGYQVRALYTHPADADAVDAKDKP
jgi:N-acyl-D-aspartate/D-glutamate deacylase